MSIGSRIRRPATLAHRKSVVELSAEGNVQLTEHPAHADLGSFMKLLPVGEDSIMIARMVGYLMLSQSQAEMERFLLEMIQAGVGREKLEELGLRDVADELNGMRSQHPI